MYDYIISYYFQGSATTTIRANSLDEAKRIAQKQMAPVLHMILEGKYQVDRSWR